MAKDDTLEEKLDEVTDVIAFVAKRMVTKDDLKNVENRLGRLELKLENFTGREIDERKRLDVRVTKLEKKVLAK